MSCLELTQYALNLLAKTYPLWALTSLRVAPFDGSFLRRRADGKAPRR